MSTEDTLPPAGPDPLQVTLPGDTEVHVTRLFHAPRHLVFRAHTTPALLQRWLLGPPGWEMPECEFDARAGGAFRYLWREMESGDSFVISGRILELEAPARIVHTEVLEMPGEPPTAASHVHTVFTEEGAQTRMVMTMRFPSREARDGAIAAGMTDGMEQSYQNLDMLMEDGAAAA